MLRANTSKAQAVRHSAVTDEFGEINPITFDRVEHLNISDIQIRSGNPRLHSEKSVDAIARAVASTRVMIPLVIAANNVLVTGEGRLAAAKLLGLKTVPVLRAEDLTEPQIQALRVADNRVGEKSQWDEQVLAVALKDLSEMDLGFNIENIGFDHAEIDVRITGLGGVIDAAEDPADQLPDVGAVAVTRPDDVWMLGKHRVTCGSALENITYERLMAGAKAHMSIQDAPYNVSVTKHVGGMGNIKHREFAMATGEMTEAQFANFLAEELKLASAHCILGAIVMAFMDWRGIDKLIGAGKLEGLELINLCVWNKSNASMGSLYRSKHELLAVFKKPGAPHRNNVQLGSYGRYRTNVWDAPGCNSFGKNRMEELASHPTVKPAQLIADAIRDVSNRGEIVLDSFLGSGTTVIAAERTGRVAYGIELDPLYVDTAVRRWQDFTGRAAVLENTGETFAETAAACADAGPTTISPRPRKRVQSPA